MSNSYLSLIKLDRAAETNFDNDVSLLLNRLLDLGVWRKQWDEWVSENSRLRQTEMNRSRMHWGRRPPGPVVIVRWNELIHGARHIVDSRCVYHYALIRLCNASNEIGGKIYNHSLFEVKWLRIYGQAVAVIKRKLIKKLNYWCEK